MKIYLVGGAVRDAWIGEEILKKDPVFDGATLEKLRKLGFKQEATERDWVVVGATPEEMLKLGFRQVGKQFPVFLHPYTKEEYALARTEHKTSHGYHGFEFDTSPEISIEADLKRRDLTINAMAQAEDGTLIDLWGGRDDIKARMLRHVSDAFIEDPVRILRVARFAARFHAIGFRVAAETIELMKRMVANGEADYLVAERVWQETAKAFATPHPSVYFKVLQEVDALAHVAPELDNLLQCIGDADINKQLFQALDMAEKKSPAVLLAILSFYACRAGTSIETLSDRWKLSRVCRWMINATGKFADQLKSVRELSAEELLDFLERADAIRNRERFEDLLEAYKLSNHTDINSEPNSVYTRRVLEALASVKLDARGLSGKFAKERMRKLQLDAMSRMRLWMRSAGCD